MKRQVPGVLTRSRLLEVARAFDVKRLTGRPKDEIVASLAGSRAIAVRDLLGILKRAELKAACRAAGTQIPACLWFLARDKRNRGFRDRRGEVLFIDARKLGRMADERVQDKWRYLLLSETDIVQAKESWSAMKRLGW